MTLNKLLLWGHNFMLYCESILMKMWMYIFFLSMIVSIILGYLSGKYAYGKMWMYILFSVIVIVLIILGFVVHQTSLGTYSVVLVLFLYLLYMLVLSVMVICLIVKLKFFWPMSLSWMVKVLLKNKISISVLL